MALGIYLPGDTTVTVHWTEMQGKTSMETGWRERELLPCIQPTRVRSLVLTPGYGLSPGSALGIKWDARDLTESAACMANTFLPCLLSLCPLVSSFAED